jgi:pimeloyl-ACP methyl ester carboxylesterase
MKTAPFTTGKIAYTVEGKGDCLVFLHGFPMDQRVWKYFKQYFIAHFKVISIDLPGFGQSDHLAESHPMSMMADVINAVLIKEKIEKCIPIGHSMGGYVALEFAKQFQEKLKGLILFHSQAAADDDTGKTNRNKAIQSVKQSKPDFLNPFVDGLFDEIFFKNNPEKVHFIREICQSQTEQAIVAALSGMRDRNDHIDLLKRIQIPVLFILGKNDIRMPVTKIITQAVMPSHAELLILDHVAHFGFLENPEVTGMTIRKFSEKCFGPSK